MTTRRNFLSRTARAGLALATLSGAGVAAFVRASGYVVDPARAAKLRCLAPWQLVVVDALAARFCAADVPYDSPGAPPTPLEVGVSEFVDQFLAESDAEVRRECLALFGMIEHAYPMSCGHLHRFSALSPAAQDDVLRSLAGSASALLQGAFTGCKSLFMMGYYRDPRTWGVLGYDGPKKGRPTEGWVPLRYRGAT
ncbi:MAG: gluconate 2-dehydrogenase subunit 3 family protein [Myxococcales bacterium]|nr:gluconate 2-dehydrogenase subunit 3 family protein [Myxococcales bacterium]